MTEKPKYNPFPFLDRDPEAIGDRMAREMNRDDAEIAIIRAEGWLRDVKEWQSARRWRIEGDKDE